MRAAKVARSVLLSALLSASAFTGVLTPAGDVYARQQALEITTTAGDLSNKVWSAAIKGNGRQAFEPLAAISAQTSDPSLLSLRESYAGLDANFKKADETRIKKLDEAWAALEKESAVGDSVPALS